MQSILELSLEDLKKFLETKGYKPFHALQIFDWIYKKGVSSFEKMSNLSHSLKEFLSQNFSIHLLEQVELQNSADLETEKFLWKLSDGKFVESVLIKSFERRTVCVSSQVGCPARCAFCASGKEGLFRNLTPYEIFAQVVQINAYLKEKEGMGVTHVVYMGMGEPLANYDSVLKSIDLLTKEELLNLSERRITVSTVGLIDEIKKLSEEGRHFNLVLSLHAPNQQIRKKIIPFARKYALEDILAAMLTFARKTKRDITYEYTLMEGINDRKEHAEELAKLVAKHPCTINLIPYNPVPGLHLKRPEKGAVEAFKKILENHGINVTWRYTKGKDIAAACGQLALKKESLKILCET